jgi:hypothetical protein
MLIYLLLRLRAAQLKSVIKGVAALKLGHSASELSIPGSEDV